ncbi:MAG: hypothetical protein ACT4PG_13825 [Panacagrimonas sp.]
MGRPAVSRDAICDEAARLICEEGHTDYRVAKSKAAERLGAGRATALPENTQVEAAVLQRQQLFGGQAYRDQLARMRATALRVMRLLSAFDPKLSGGAVSGAIGDGHRVQIHVQADQPEAVEILLHDRRVRFEQDERRYRMADGRDQQVPLLCVEADDIGVDIAVFEHDSQRNPPLSPIDGKPARRLSAAQLGALIEP